MQKVIVTKQSLRELTKMRRLPQTIHMFLAGGWLAQLLETNSLKQFRLVHMAYQVRARRLNRTQMILTWKPVQ